LPPFSIFKNLGTNKTGGDHDSAPTDLAGPKFNRDFLEPYCYFKSVFCRAFIASLVDEKCLYMIHFVYSNPYSDLGVSFEDYFPSTFFIFATSNAPSHFATTIVATALPTRFVIEIASPMNR